MRSKMNSTGISKNDFITWGDLNDILDAFAERLQKPKSKFVTRQEIISDIGRAEYDEAIRKGKLTKLKGKGRTGRVKINRKEYESYINSLSR